MDLSKTFSEFSYDSLSPVVADRLKGLSDQLDGIYQNYSVAVGKVLYQAQQELANYDGGTFQRWVESKGISKSNAYNYINNYRLVQQLDNPQEREIFLKQPQRLKNEMSKPSAFPEVNQAVFDGDITTHKQYKEMEYAWKRKYHSAVRKVAELEERLEDQGKPKEVVKEVEVAPADYNEAISLSKELMESNKAHVERNAFLERQLSELSEQREKAAKYDDIERAIERGQGHLNEQQKEIAGTKEAVTFLKKGNQFLANFGGISYLDIQSVLPKNAQLRIEVETFATQLKILLDDVNAILGQSKNEILEGEIL